jgi:hypothetical protein
VDEMREQIKEVKEGQAGQQKLILDILSEIRKFVGLTRLTSSMFVSSFKFLELLVN